MFEKFGTMPCILISVYFSLFVILNSNTRKTSLSALEYRTIQKYLFWFPSLQIESKYIFWKRRSVIFETYERKP